jgi:hypothetical protein
MGKKGGDIERASTSCRSVPPPWPGAYSVTIEPGLSAAEKNGIPCMWSQCRWPSTMAPEKGLPPNRWVACRIPVPPSKIRVGGLTVAG